MGITPPDFTISEIRYLPYHSTVEADSLFDDGESFFSFLHLSHVLGVVLGRKPFHFESDTTVVYSDLITDFTTKQFIYR